MPNKYFRKTQGEKKNPARSDKYQWIIVETPVTHDFLAVVADRWADSQAAENEMQTSQGIKDRLADLRSELYAVTLEAVQEIATPNQWQVFSMLLEGKTQWEIAETLGVNQSSVTKALNGNRDYANGKVREYGGLFHKLKKKKISEHPKVKPVLDQINRLTQKDYSWDELFGSVDRAGSIYTFDTSLLTTRHPTQEQKTSKLDLKPKLIQTPQAPQSSLKLVALPEAPNPQPESQNAPQGQPDALATPKAFKVCSYCQKSLPIELFRPLKNRTDRFCYCKECAYLKTYEYKKLMLERNPVYRIKMNNYMKEYRKNKKRV